MSLRSRANRRSEVGKRKVKFKKYKYEMFKKIPQCNGGKRGLIALILLDILMLADTDLSVSQLQ